jgi:cytochrome c553
MKLFTNKVAAAVIVASIMIVSAPNVLADGKSFFASKGCEGCHGTEGAGSVGPRLAGQQEKYLIEQFKLIRDEKRTTGLSSMMAPVVHEVSDEDISAIAAYLSGL